MANPYQAPQSDVAEPRRSRGKGHTVVSLVIAAFCIMQFLGVWLAILRFVAETGLENAPLLLLAKKAALPFSLLLGGVFLAFGRKLSAFFFAAYIIQYIIEFGGSGNLNLLTAALGVGFLSYSLWSWKAGRLRGWPNNSYMDSSVNQDSLV